MAKAPTPQQVEVIASNFETGMKVFSGLGSVAAAAQGGFAIYNMLQAGGKSDTDRIVDAIESMTNKLVSKLQEVVDIGNDGNKIKLWSRNREKIIECKEKIVDRARELATYDEDKHMVVVNGDWVSIPVWCKQDTGVLADLYKVLRDVGLVLNTSTFETKNAIDEWDDLVTSGTVGRVLGVRGETRFSLMFEWFQSICTMVQMATFVYNAALVLYWESSSPDSGISALDKLLDDLFGRAVADLDTMLDELGRMSFVDGNGTTQPAYGVWATFEAKFDDILDVGMKEDSSGRVFANCSADPDDHLALFSDDHKFYTGGFRMPEGSNCYIAALEIGYQQIGWVLGEGGGWRVRGTVVKVTESGQTGAWRESTGEAKVATDWGVDWHSNGEPEGGQRIYAGDFLGVGMVDPPSVALSHNEGLVVTGYSVKKHNGVFAIGLEYGRLTIGPEGMITITALPADESGFRFPHSYTDFFKLRKEVDKLHRGRAGTRSLLPLTNASFGRINYAVNLRVGCAWTAFRADIFQPAYLKKYTPKLF